MHDSWRQNAANTHLIADARQTRAVAMIHTGLGNAARSSADS